MKNYSIKPYQKEDYAQWNSFLAQAKNATFLFHRDFIEYHSDRFQDHSLLVFESEKLVAILPANRVGAEVYSHQGLTYGGLVYNETIKVAAIIMILKSILSFLQENKIEKLHLKTIPAIYHNKPAEELNYALFLADASLVRRDSLSVIDLKQELILSKDRKEGYKKGLKKELLVKEVQEFDEFWNEILIPNLEIKHQAHPVHMLAEITKLKKLFPENIRQFNVYHQNKMVAGTTIFESNLVAHSQYISGNENKNENGSLDFLHIHLLKNVFKDKKYFDFGSSNEAQGKKLNSGLSYWKESFGANTIVHDFYEVETKNYIKLNNVLV